MTERPEAARGGVVRVPLSRGHEAIVDTSDLHLISPYRWHFIARRGHKYAEACEKGQRILMHRLILGAVAGQVVDHANGNGLDNTRANIRLCTQRDNMCNQRVQTTGRKRSKFKGVSANRRGKPWSAAIPIDGRKMYLGAFRSEEEAARAYDAAAKELHGAFACTNDNMKLFDAA